MASVSVLLLLLLSTACVALVSGRDLVLAALLCGCFADRVVRGAFRFPVSPLFALPWVVCTPFALVTLGAAWLLLAAIVFV